MIHFTRSRLLPFALLATFAAGVLTDRIVNLGGGLRRDVPGGVGTLLEDRDEQAERSRVIDRIGEVSRLQDAALEAGEQGEVARHQAELGRLYETLRGLNAGYRARHPEGPTTSR